MALKIYHLHPLVAGAIGDWSPFLADARTMGFDHVATAPLFAPGSGGNILLAADHERLHPALGASGSADETIAALAASCAAQGLGLVLDLVIDRVASDALLRAREPGWFEDTDAPRDPRLPLHEHHAARARVDQPEIASALAAWWIERLSRLTRAGVAGFRCLHMERVPAVLWRQLIEGVRVGAPRCRFIAWTPGMAREATAALAGVGFDHIASSLAWWDVRGTWMVEEAEHLRRVAPLIASPEPSFSERLAWRLDARDDPAVAYRRALRLTAGIAGNLLVPMGGEFASGIAFDPIQASPQDWQRARAEAAGDLRDDIARANALVDRVAEQRLDGAYRALTGPGQRVIGVLRADANDIRLAQRAVVVLANPDLSHPAPRPPLQPLSPAAGAAFGEAQPLDGDARKATLVGPGEVCVLRYQRVADASLPLRDRPSLDKAIAVSRIAIEAITPSIDGGVFPVKRTIGESITVEADLIADGHDLIAAAVRWRSVDSSEWQRTPMRLRNNDRWEAEIRPERVGPHQFTVEAWWDEWGSFRRDLTTKRDAGLDVALEIDEGHLLLQRIADGSSGEAATALQAIARDTSRCHPSRIETLLSEDTRAAVMRADPRPFLARHEPPLPLDIDRPQAVFANWYELFPRSITDDAARHGTFADVVGRLPAIRDMGFDVLYFPPIHPIGVTNRKGRNNSLRAAPDDVGSPYAIGGKEGGHDAIHPALGTLDDFKRLVAAAHEHGLEIALDFAIQCSPDHPWLKQHPDWFRFRPDGSVRYAENPPKRYEDIVNVDFYAPGAARDLWLALRDVVLFWAAQGVRIFRVDNPHTKPLPFWQWMIAEVRARAPDAIFLAEAFTRPKMMYRLAKVGFTQSYTYFTWRDLKAEITEYLTELSTPPVADFYRPNFFVNTPDINPVFLQTSGRGGFLIRAALATTLSGLWGMYSGFEICEAAPLPGREEYLDSEKYEIRPRNFSAPGNIVGEITLLNRLRRMHPALQTHCELRFYQAYNDQILLYGRGDPADGDMILVAVSLDPRAPQEADIEIPLWEWGLPDHGSLAAEDLIHDRRFTWTGKAQHIRLDPFDLPFAIWRIAPVGAV